LNVARKKRQISLVRPGEILNNEFLKPLGMTIDALAIAFRMPSNRIYAMAEGDTSISGNTALRRARYFGTSAEFWVNLQARCDLEIALKDAEEDLERALQPRELLT
jgi:addiction module HigA family antidote